MNELKIPTFNPPKIDKSYNKASGYVERIESKIYRFIQDVPENKKPLIYVLLSDGDKIFNPDFGYHNPYIIIVDGIDENDNQVKSLINQNNIQVVMKYL